MQQNSSRELHRIVSTAIIYDDRRRFLLIKRSPNKKVYPGKWTVPGGGLTVDDYEKMPKTTSDGWYNIMSTSLRREIKEEVNIDVDKLRYLLDMTFIRPDKIPVIVLSYYGHYTGGEVKLDEENVDYAWATAEEAKLYDLIDGIPQEIEMVDRILNGEPPDQVEFRPTMAREGWP